MKWTNKPLKEGKYLWRMAHDSEPKTVKIKYDQILGTMVFWLSKTKGATIKAVGGEWYGPIKGKA